MKKALTWLKERPLLGLRFKGTPKDARSMRNLQIAAALLPLLSSIAMAQTPSTPVSPGIVPNQSTPEVIVPPRAVDPGVVVAPKMAPTSDPNTIVPGQGGLGMSEPDARLALGDAGYTALSNLARRPDGGWSATARKNGAAVTVVIDRTGKIASN